MVEKILEKIITEMAPHLDNGQLEHLCNVLYVNFHGMEIQEQSGWSIMQMVNHAAITVLRICLISSSRPCGMCLTTLHIVMPLICG